MSDQQKPTLTLVENRPCSMIMVLAVAIDGAIGRDNTMPWYFKEDLQRFKRMTMGHVVVMGRVTFESIVQRIHKPLPGRINVVMTRAACGRSEFLKRYPGHLIDGYDVRFVSTVDEVLAIQEDEEEKHNRSTYVIGGAQIYRLLLPYVYEIEATVVSQVYPDADTYIDFDSIRRLFQLVEENYPDNIETPITFQRLARKSIIRHFPHMYSQNKNR